MIQNYDNFKRWNAKSDKIYIFNFWIKNSHSFYKTIPLASFDSWEHQILTLSRWMTDQDILQQTCVTSYELWPTCSLLVFLVLYTSGFQSIMTIQTLLWGECSSFFCCGKWSVTKSHHQLTEINFTATKQ